MGSHSGPCLCLYMCVCVCVCACVCVCVEFLPRLNLFTPGRIHPIRRCYLKKNLLPETNLPSDIYCFALFSIKLPNILNVLCKKIEKTKRVIHFWSTDVEFSFTINILEREASQIFYLCVCGCPRIHSGLNSS